jgi:hypothetical protein
LSGIGEAVIGKVLDAVIRGLAETFKGTDAQLRRVVPIALATAADQTTLPDGYDAAWVAREILDDAAAAATSRLEVVGVSENSPADFEESAISERLRVALRPELIEDLTGLGIDVHRVVDRFGPSLVGVVRSRATGSKTSLDAIATRFEADSISALLDNVAAAVGANRQDQSTTLDEMEHESSRRIHKRLDVLGVTDATVLAAIIRSLDLVPLPEFENEGLFGLVAEGGSGKTTLAERLHLASIWVARFNRSAPLPLFIEAASEVSIREEIQRVWSGVPDLLTRGVDIVLDGLDEPGLTRGQAYVAELRSLVNDPLSSVRRAVVTARPLDFGLREDEKTHIGRLSEEQSTAIVAMISGKPAHAVTMTPVLSDAIRRPFFAIASGVVLGEDHGQDLATPSRILKWVALKAIGPLDASSVDLLSRAAAASVDLHHGFVPLRKIAKNFAEQEILKANRTIEVDSTGEKIRFPVALIAEWFAAEHLMNHEHVITGLVADARRLELWRYPLLLAIEARDAIANETLLKTLATEAPAMSGWLLTQPDPYHTAYLGRPEGVEVHRDRAELTTEFLTAVSAVGSGASPGSSLLKIFKRGRPNPIWLDTSNANIDFAWATNAHNDPDVIENPPNFQHPELGRWIRFSSAGMSEHPAWMWRRAHCEISDDLAALRKTGVLFANLPKYEQEARWCAALDASGRSGSYNPGKVQIDTLQEKIDTWDALIASLNQPIRDDPQIALLRRIVHHLQESHLGEIEAPWPIPDNLRSGIGWVWALWSDEAILERLNGVTEAGLDLYVAAVDRYLPRFRKDLRSYQESTTRTFRGFRQSIGKVEPGMMDVPISWTFAPGEPGVSWEIVDDPHAAAMDLVKSSPPYRVNQGELHGLYENRPATLFAMSLLEEDLAPWGWGKHGNVPLK